ncbi:cytochrome c oxidase subunit II [Patulibacter sp. NPDC049589]|uniref:cytochrome c oxidase subunit II n=1 Tax=Patulibacter sp. NPDC049589 TaxID=3154731 RepID=UPI0034454F03
MRRLNRIPHLTRASWRTATSAIALAIGLTLVTAGPASASFWAPQHGGSPNADRIHTLYAVVFGVGVVIFIAVFGALVYAMVKFRARPGAVAEQLHGNTRLEIGWTAGAAAIVLVLGIVTFLMLPGIRNPDNSDKDGFDVSQYQTAKDKDLLPPNGQSLNIDVNGQQYAWRFTYPDKDADRQNNVQSYEEMVVPTGTTVTLDIRSSDVGHAWWIPQLGGKADALPGYTNHTWFKVPAKALRNDDERENGRVFKGNCAELCGRNHANMTAQVRAVTPAKFQEWLDRQSADLVAAHEAAVKFRQEQQQSDKAEAAAAAAVDSDTTSADPSAPSTDSAAPAGAER